MRILLSIAAFLSISFAAHAGLQEDFDLAMANYKIRIEVAFTEYKAEAALIEARMTERVRQIDHDKFEKDAAWGNGEYVKASEARVAELALAQASYDSKTRIARDLYTSETDAACRKYSGSNCPR